MFSGLPWVVTSIPHQTERECNDLKEPKKKRIQEILSVSYRSSFVPGKDKIQYMSDIME